MFLEIKQIYKSFGQGDSRVEVLKGIDLSLEKGGFCVLLGPSGSGKFDEEGIQSLAELTGPEYMEVIRRVKAARDAEHSYNNFSGILDGQKGSVRFVIETDEIEAVD